MDNAYYKVVAECNYEQDVYECVFRTLAEAEAHHADLIGTATRERGSEAWTIFMGADRLVLFRCTFGEGNWSGGGVRLTEFDVNDWRERNFPDAPFEAWV